MLYKTKLYCSTTINVKIDSCEKLALVARQEEHRVGHILHLCQTTERDIPQKLLAVLWGVRNTGKGLETRQIVTMFFFCFFLFLSETERKS